MAIASRPMQALSRRVRRLRGLVRALGCPGARSARHPPRAIPGTHARNPVWIALALLMACNVQGEVYRYQDPDGRWHFTDRPPPGQVAIDANASDGSDARAEAAAPPTRDLAARLRARFEPSTPVQESSLAVVKIVTETGNGSGFFASPDGLILTNRHVVRPPEDWAKTWERKLAEMKVRLDGLERQLERPRSAYSNKDDYDEGKRILRTKSREYRIAKRELDMKRYAANLQSGFRVELKDGTTLSANLVDVSTTHDLALLELTGYKTPYLSPLESRRLEQGEPVYAIGSPLGISDTITKGVFTSRRDGLLVTDARILPGNSGGPLLTEDGEVVGINVIKVTQGGQPATDRGFGLAIPIRVAFDAFLRIRQR